MNEKKMEIVYIPLDLIDIEPTLPPSKVFVENIKTHGLKEPVNLSLKENGRYRINNGRRRVLVYQTLGIPEIPAKIEDTDTDSDLMTLTLSVHRSCNIGADLVAVKNLVKKGCLTMKEIADAICIQPRRLSRVFKLINLCPKALELLMVGKISENMALQLSRLTHDDQMELIEEHDAKIPRKALEESIRKHNLQEGADLFNLEDYTSPEPAIVNQFEEVVNLLVSTGKVTPEVKDAISVLRTFISEVSSDTESSSSLPANTSVESKQASA